MLESETPGGLRTVPPGIARVRAALGRLRRRVVRLQTTFRQRRVYELRVGPGAGLRFCPGPAEAGYATGENEAPVQSALAALLPSGSTFFDVGANVGFMTVIGARLVGEGGRVYAFEPVPANLKLIRRNLELNGLRNVDVLEKAVANRVGTEQLVIAAYSGGAALSSAAMPPDAIGRLDVDVISIDELVKTGQTLPPTLVKIDVEGAEMQVLEGMEETLVRHRPAIVYELDGPDAVLVQSKETSCAEFLEARRYVVARLPDSYPLNRWCVRHYVAMPAERSFALRDLRLAE